MSITTQRFLIAGGNPTLLVWECPVADRAAFATAALGDVEQVGFVDDNGGVPLLTMMGNELCINAMLALASVTMPHGLIHASGVHTTVSSHFDIESVCAEITAPLPYRRDKNIILFQGIGYVCLSQASSRISKDDLRTYARTYRLPAFGAIYHEHQNIEPHVYVVETDSLYQESACGSGSVAFSIWSDMPEVAVVQPTGETITVVRCAPETFLVRAIVLRDK